MQHSKVVGGSTAKRVIHCPGSVALVAKMPPQILQVRRGGHPPARLHGGSAGWR